jgi:hypothetical protein
LEHCVGTCSALPPLAAALSAGGALSVSAVAAGFSVSTAADGAELGFGPPQATTDDKDNATTSRPKTIRMAPLISGNVRLGA